jgi:hypothetical protein
MLVRYIYDVMYHDTDIHHVYSNDMYTTVSSYEFWYEAGEECAEFMHHTLAHTDSHFHCGC